MRDGRGKANLRIDPRLIRPHRLAQPQKVTIDEVRPVSVATTTGKNEINTANVMRDVLPMPSQIVEEGHARHGSSRSRFTCSMVGRGRPFGRRGMTGTPLRMRGTRFGSMAFRASSERTRPAVVPRLEAISLAICRTSSSISRVVLMRLASDITHLMSTAREAPRGGGPECLAGAYSATIKGRDACLRVGPLTHCDSERVWPGAEPSGPPPFAAPGEIESCDGRSISNRSGSGVAVDGVPQPLRCRWSSLRRARPTFWNGVCLNTDGACCLPPAAKGDAI